ncbi:MAG: transcription antitermination factor NusB [Oscillospiraceae bacterium]
MANKNYNVRDSVFKLLFEKHWREDDSLQTLCDIAKEEKVEDIVISNKVVKIANGVIEHQDEIDETIKKYLIKRTLENISVVDLIILRLAIYEINFDEKVPTNTAIYEAVKLAQTYSVPKDVKFINGLLGAYSRDIKVEE